MASERTTGKLDAESTARGLMREGLKKGSRAMLAARIANQTENVADTLIILWNAGSWIRWEINPQITIMVFAARYTQKIHEA